MSIYKPSNPSPFLEEIDLTKFNTFNCVSNTTGESVQAYKMEILSGDGTTRLYDPNSGTNLLMPIRNKQEVKINVDPNDITSPNRLPDKLSDYGIVNGKDYLWGIRLYNQKIGATTQPNTKVCDGFITGSTKYVVWSRIPKGDASLDQLVYDRYIEFTNIPANKLIVSNKQITELPQPTQPFTQRKKIDWVEKDLGTNEDIVKIETTYIDVTDSDSGFTYNFADGVQYNIYLCSDKHTVKSAFIDPNSNINVSDFIIIYDSATKARTAFNNHETPDTGSSYVLPSTKIIGYSSDTGEIRIHDNWSSAPKNGYAYRIFKKDVETGVYTELFSPQVNATNPDYSYQVIGGRPITSNNFKVLTNTDSRLFIQPNINIKTDYTNPNELVFTQNGCRIDILKKTKLVNGKQLDITFNKLDNTMWLLENVAGESDVISVASGSIPKDSNGNIRPQTDYSVFTDFMDMQPYAPFYARKEPTLTLQYRNAVEDLKEGKFIDEHTFINISGVPYEPSFLDLYYDLSSGEYYRYRDSERTGYTFEKQNVDTVWFDLDINGSVPETYSEFREVEFRCLWAESDPQIKSYRYSLYSCATSEPKLVKESEETYNNIISWIFRGLDGINYSPEAPHKYKVNLILIDNYDKSYTISAYFNIYYPTSIPPTPIAVDLDCDEQALTLSLNTPIYAATVAGGDPDNGEFKPTVFNISRDGDSAQINIGSDQIYNVAATAADDEDLFLPKSFSFFTEFRITKEFIAALEEKNKQDIYTEKTSQITLMELCHNLEDNPTDVGDDPQLEYFYLKLNSPLYRYFIKDGVITQNTDRLALQWYRHNVLDDGDNTTQDELLTCIDIKGEKYDKYSLLSIKGDGSVDTLHFKNALQDGSEYIFISQMIDPNLAVTDTYYILTKDSSYNGTLYISGVYKAFLTSSGRRAWEAARNTEYVYIDKLSDTDPESTYESLGAPSTTHGENGELLWAEDNGEIWVDSYDQDKHDQYVRILNKTVRIFLRVDHSTGTEEIYSQIELVE